MAQKLNPFSGRQFLDASGDPYAGAQLFVYLAGSTTKQTVTKDSAGSSNHANPIILNARGEPADAGGSSQAIWQPEGVSVKLVLASSTDSDPPTSPISTWDNLGGVNDVADATADQWVSGPTPTYVSGTQFTLVGDQTTDFHVGRRVKTTNSGGTVYGVITASAYTSLTTITIDSDSGTLDSGLSAVSYGLLTSDNPSIPDLEKIRVLNTSILTDNPPATAGTSSAYTATLFIDAYTTDRVYRVQIHTDNAGACTLNLDGNGAKNVKTIEGNDPSASSLRTGMIAKLLYDGTNLVILNPFSEKWIQSQTTTTGAVSTITGNIPLDDTIPQNTEGGEVATVSIAPKKVGNRLVVKAQVFGSSASASIRNFTVAIFQDSTADALAATSHLISSTGRTALSVTAEVSAAGTSSTTFKVRTGLNADNFDVNGNGAGGRLFGGVGNTFITVDEYGQE